MKLKKSLLLLLLALFSLQLISCNQYQSQTDLSQNSAKVFRALSSDEIDLGGGLTISQQTLRDLENQLPRTDQDQVFFHWTTEANTIRWGLDGSISWGELDFLNRPDENGRQVYGPGFYVAEKNYTSEQFGNALNRINIPKGTLLYDEDIAKNLIGTNLGDNQRARLGQHLPILRHATDDWYVINHADLLRDIRFGSKFRDAIQNKIIFSNTLELYKAFWNGIRSNPNGNYLDSLLTLAYYQDGISLIRSIKSFPDNPWGQFEPEHFEKFKNTLHNVIAKSMLLNNISLNDMPILNGLNNISKETADLGIQHNNKFSSKSLSLSQWVDKQKNDVLVNIYRSISGDTRGGSIEDLLRTEGIRAGGNEIDNTFLATVTDATNLLKNPYLETVTKPNPSGEGFLVHYFYPDVFHFEHLKSKLSNKLYRQLQKIDPQILMKDVHLRQQLNKQIVSELLDDIFKKYHKENIDYRTGKSIEMMIDLISIHPFENFNGRTIRMYIMAAHLQSGLEIPLHILADFDVLKSPAFYKEMLLNTELPFAKFREGMLKELLIAAEEGRKPQYNNLAEIDGLMDSLNIFGKRTNLTFDNNLYKLISERKFTEFFDLTFSKFWRYSDIAGVLNVLIYNQDNDFKTKYLKQILDIKFFDAIDKKSLAYILDGIDNLEEYFEFTKLITKYGREELIETTTGHFTKYVVENNNYRKLKTPEMNLSFIEGSSWLMNNIYILQDKHKTKFLSYFFEQFDKNNQIFSNVLDKIINWQIQAYICDYLSKFDNKSTAIQVLYKFIANSPNTTISKNRSYIISILEESDSSLTNELLALHFARKNSMVDISVSEHLLFAEIITYHPNISKNISIADQLTIIEDGLKSNHHYVITTICPYLENYDVPPSIIKILKQLTNGQSDSLIFVVNNALAKITAKKCSAHLQPDN